MVDKRSRWADCALFALLLSSATLIAQNAQAPQPATAAPTLERLEGTDPATGVHYVRLLLSLPAGANASLSPRFTVECVADKNQRDLLWYISFGGVADPGFTPPFRSSQNNLFPPQYPSVNLKMAFEGYIKSKPFTRSWAVLPSGVLRYRNPGADSPNMDSTRSFLAYLNSLPGLRIVHAKASKADPGEVFFPTQPLLDELKRTPVCAP
ncbi:MAG TPA: hypothetical protein VGG56_09450 [Terracidiphilus sp.]|jgi:hypothetical protein